MARCLRPIALLAVVVLTGCAASGLTSAARLLAGLARLSGQVPARCLGLPRPSALPAATATRLALVRLDRPGPAGLSGLSGKLPVRRLDRPGLACFGGLSGKLAVRRLGSLRPGRPPAGAATRLAVVRLN
jgi:hypothetical protein